MGIAQPGISRWVPDPAAEPALVELTVGDLLDQAANSWPDREAVVFSAYEDMGISARWSFEELRRRARRVGKALIASGIEPGERFGIWATNIPQWLELQFGAAYVGAVIVPMNPLYRAGEVEFVLAKSKAAACFVLPENRGAGLWGITVAASAGLDHVRLLVPIGEADGAPSWEEWLASGDGVDEDRLERRRAAVRPADTSQIQFTSGTTGFPKGAELSHAGIVNNARLFAHRATLPQHGRHSNPMPYFHCGGCVMSTLGSIATGSAQMPAVTFDPARISRTIEAEGCTSASMVPTMMIGLEEQVGKDGRDLSSLQIVVTGGSPVPPEVSRRWMERYGVGINNTYGMTECSPVICATLPDDPVELQTRTVGPPLPHIEVDVVEPGGTEPVPIGVEGELRSRSAMIMAGYWDNPEATAEAIDADGFMRSGDLARMDENGYVAITGRAKEMIIRGGENIYPAEIENAIRELDAVADAAVIGVPDERYGEVCAAYVRLHEGAALDEDQLREGMQGRVARYKIPAHVRFLAELPLTPSGKVQKFKLREDFLGAAAAAETKWEDAMPEERWFEPQELEQMSQPTMDRAIAAIEAGDSELALELCKAMRHEWRFLHDVMAESMLGLVTYIQQQQGDDGVAAAWEESLRRGWKRDAGKTLERDRREIVALLAATWRAHSGSATGQNPGAFTILEDEEKFTFEMNPCGSGQRLWRNGAYSGEDPYGVTEKAHDWSYGREGFPLYCTHCAFMNELLPIRWYGLPLYPSRAPQDFDHDPCTWYWYKDPKKIPDEYWRRYGLERAET